MTTIRVALEPAHNALVSLGMLTHAEEYSGLGDWIVQTYAALSDKRKHDQQLIFHALWGALQTERSWPSFTAYLSDLAAEDPYVLRDRVFSSLRDCCEEEYGRSGAAALPDPAELLNDATRYLQVMQRLEDEGETLDAELYREAHALLNDPPALRKRITSHLRVMWDELLAAEWERVQPLLEESVRAFQGVELARLSLPEAIRMIVGRDLRPGPHDAQLTRAAEVIFVPSAHIGPYVHILYGERISRLAFGARLPEGSKVQSPALTRSEMLVRLSALADDTRLRILDLLTDYQKISAQEIMARLGLSQSSASRHLIQLSAAGFLIEERQERNKYYQLNRERFEDVAGTLKGFSGKRRQPQDSKSH
jgi:DNA-binding transcriptional ArsR family regulator